MTLKTNLHLHSREDSSDVLKYSIWQAIDKAAELGFEVLAWTPHRQVLCRPEHVEYAKQKGIILFPGIEAKIAGREVVIINCGQEAEKIKTFAELRDYKKTKKEVLILAPHPFFPAKSVLAEKLEENIDLFDAVEKSWFYTPKVDFNIKAAKIATKHQKPLISTSDTHHLRCLNKSYALVDSAKNPAAILAAIRENKFKNFSKPIYLWQAILFLLWLDFRPIVIWLKLKRKIRRFLAK